MSKNLAKKIFAGLSAAAVTLTAFPAFVSAAAHPVGTNVDYQGTVWMVYNGNSGVCRRAYTSAGAFLSYGFNSWGQVVMANADDLALPVCSEGFIPPQDGSIIFSDRGADKGTGYVISGGMKYGYPTEAAFKGQGYSYSNATWADVSWMSMGGVVNDAASAHVAGALINNGGTVQLVGNSGLMGIPDIATFNSWGYSFAKVVPANAADTAKAQTGVMSMRQAGQLSPTAMTTTPVVTGNINVSLASTNPASGALINDESQANLAEFMFSGTGTVTGITLQRTGISADTSLSNVYLFEGNTRISDAASVTSGSLINFSNAGGLFMVSGSKTISVRADLAASAGETVGVKLTVVTLSSGTVGGLPLSGNNHSIAAASLAGADFGTAPTGSGATDPGEGINVWQGTLSVTTRDVTLTRLALRQIGSIQPADIKNFKLFVDGVEIATQASLDSNGYVTFTLSKLLTTGSRVLKVTADVIGGSGRTVQMSLRGAYDIKVVDSQYNASPVVTATGDAFPYDPAAFTVNNGTVTIVKAADSPSQNLTVGASDVPLGRWTATAYGESVKIETLTIAVDTTGGTTSEHSLRNGRVLINGSQYGSTTTVAAVDSHASGQSFTVNYTIVPGTPVTIEFRADMFDNEDTNNISAGTVTSIQAAVFGGDLNNAVPQISLGTLDVPSSTQVANDLSISAGTISLSENLSYVDQTTAVPQSSFKLGQWTLTGNSAESVNINTIEVGFVDADAWDASDDLSNVFVKYGANTTSIKGTVSDGSSTSLANSWSPTFTLGVNESMNIELWGSIASGASDGGGNDTLTPYMRITGVTSMSGTTVYADTDSDTDNTDAGAIAQTTTGGSGSITATKDASSPVAQLVDDSGTVTTVAWKFAALTDSYTITDLSFSVPDGTTFSSLSIKDGASTVATKPGGATSYSFSGLNVPVAANANKVLTVELTMSTVGVGGGTSEAEVTTTMVAFTARNSGGTSAAGTESNPAGSAIYVYKALPTVTYENLPSSLLTAGTKTLAKFTVNTNGTGSVAWKQVMIEIVKEAGPVLASYALYDVTGGGNTLITAAEVIQNDSDGGDADCDAADLTCELLISVGTNADDNVEELVTGSKTYEVRAAVSGTIGTTDYVTSSIETYLSHADNAVYTGVDNDTTTDDATFVWSDISASGHDTGTADWSNGVGIKNIPTSSWTLIPPAS